MDTEPRDLVGRLSRDWQPYELLERDGALKRVAHVVTAARRGDGGALVCESPAGTGKTALLDSAAQIAGRERVRVLRAQAFELEAHFGLGVVRQLLERSVTQATAQERAELFDGPAGLAASVLGVPIGKNAPPSSLEAVIHGLYWLVLNLCRAGPVVLIIDDVHWADEASWQWLVYLARRVDGVALGLIVAGRSDTRGGERRCAEIARVCDEDPVVLGPLSPTGVRRLIELASDGDADAEFADACFELTQGNPFLVVELLRAVRVNGLPPVAASVQELRKVTPDRVAWSVRARLDRLGESSGLVARNLAVLGHGSLDEIAAVAGTIVSAAAEGIDLLVASDLVRREETFTFVHPLVRQAIYDGIPPGQLLVLHRAAARILAERGGSLDRVASHLLQVPPGADEWIASRLLDAARHASDQRAFPTAVTYLRRAAQEHTPAAVHVKILGDLGLAEGKLRDPESVRHLYEAIKLDADPVRKVRLVRALGRALMLEGRVSEGVSVLERGIEALNGERSAEAWGLEMDIQAFGRTDPETVATADRRIHRLMNRAVDDPGLNRRLDLLLVQRPCWEGTDWHESHRRAIARLSGRPSKFDADPEALGNYTAVQALGWCDHYEEALGYLEFAFEAAARHGSITAHVLASTYRAEVHLRRGAFAQAEADATAAVQLIDEHRLQIPAALAFAWLVTATIERGRASEGWEVIPSRGFDKEIPALPVFAMLHEARARLHMVDHRADRSLADALQAGQLLAALGPGPTALPWRSTAALAAHQQGRVDQARRLAGEELALARRFGAPRPVGIALRTAALVGPADPVPLLRESVAVLKGSEVRGELARSLVELGSLMRKGRQANESRVVLREALDLAHRCDGVVLVQRARDELVAAGGRPRRPSTQGLEALTPRELRVAQIAAAGFTNRQIAQTLFITPRTVEHHLGSIYRKLGITSRAQLQGLANSIDRSEATPDLK